MTVEYNKRMNQTLEQKLCQMEEKYSKLVWYARNREGASTAMKEVEANYPNESARLNGKLPGFISDEMNEELKKQIAETMVNADWEHGFNSGCLAALRFVLHSVENAVIPSENCCDTDTIKENIEIAEDMFQCLIPKI